MKDKILLLGSSGLLGSALNKAPTGHAQVLTPSRFDLNLTDLDALETYIKAYKPSLIINAAGMVSAQQCEHNADQAFKLNTDLPAKLAQLSKAQGSTLVHFSCLDVYGDESRARSLSSCTENTPTNPQNIYAESKLLGDNAVAEHAEDYLIFRLSGLYSKQDLSVKNERPPIVIGAPTSAEYVAVTVMRSLERVNRGVIRVHPGVYHLSTKGEACWQEFYREVALLRQNRQLLVNSPSLVTKDSRLCMDKVEDTFCLLVPSWRSQLKSIITDPKDFAKAVGQH
ncbi:MAG: sugar nucleotide-binding protein [Firmicutes bacterium]|nr:sugar nucleotide-binding protein [Bacillota bacterium]